MARISRQPSRVGSAPSLHASRFLASCPITSGGSNLGEMSHRLSQMWHRASKEEKAPYEEEYARDWEAYVGEMKNRNPLWKVPDSKGDVMAPTGEEEETLHEEDVLEAEGDEEYKP
jgi:hypothetical protein